MGPTSAALEWPESAWHYLVRPGVTWRQALQGSAFLATSTIAGAGLLLLAGSVRRSRRRDAR